MSTRIVMQMLVRECELCHTGKMSLSATSPMLANMLDARGSVDMLLWYAGSAHSSS